MSVAQKMLDLYRPKLEAFAICSPAEVQDGDKRKAKYVTYKETLTAEHIAAHFADASKTVTAIPNAEPSACYFGGIDIDDYSDGVLEVVIAKIKRWNLPFICARSKSGGPHLYWFFDELTDAAEIQVAFGLWATLFGYKCDIIPKSREVKETGNGINLPYAGIEAGSKARIGYDLDGIPMINAEAWLDLAASRVAPLRSPPVFDGPPCLQRIALDGLGENAGRNNALFNYAVYAKLKHGDDDFENYVDDFNRDHFDPHLNRAEVTTIIQSAARRDYFYACDSEPCASLCNKPLCKTREFGVGSSKSTEQLVHELTEQDSEAVLLPSHQFSARDSSALIFARLAETATYYLRADRLAEIIDDRIEPIKAQDFRTVIEKLGTTYALNVGNQAGIVRAQRRAVSLDHANVILGCDVRRELLETISLVSPVPLLNDDGSLMSPGWNDGGVFVTGDVDVPVIEYDEAREAVLDLLSDFDFVTRADHARAFAMMITPAFRMSKLIDAPVPIDYAEADTSQAGKTLRQAVNRGIYGARVPLIAKTKGGVGSLDESIGNHLFKGYPFAAIDNARGKLDSEVIEAITTSPDGFVNVRIPHIGNVRIDVSRSLIQITSNGIHMTVDLANRCCIVRIRKRPMDYNFKRDNLLAHVKENQARYLGCVYAIARDWIERGRPATVTGDHDMRLWQAAFSDICTRAGLPDMMAGHIQIKERVTSPIKGWLRAVSLHLPPDEEHSVTELCEISEAHGIDLPVRPSSRMLQVIGRQLAPLFEGDETCEIDGITVHRSQRKYDKKDADGNAIGTGVMKLYSRERDQCRDGKEPY